MKHKFSKRILDILACPDCGGSLRHTNVGVKCSNCQQEYPLSSDGQLDLRLRKKKQYQLQFELGTNLLPDGGFEFGVLQENPHPEVDFTKVEVPRHLSKELMSYFPIAKSNDSIMLDLGCGDTVHRKVCEHAGFEYVGLDYNSVDAPILGDAHSLPFKDNSFEFILSIAVLEHIRYPFVMMKEAYRVLKPGGKFIGTVAFLEPFHGDSFYHHTHLGTYNSLEIAGFDIRYIAPSVKWHVLYAQAIMSLYPGLPRPISKLLVLPAYLLHMIWWKIGYILTSSESLSECNRILITTGSISFIASKPMREFIVASRGDGP